MSYRCRTSVGCRHVSDTLTHLQNKMSMLHKYFILPLFTKIVREEIGCWGTQSDKANIFGILDWYILLEVRTIPIETHPKAKYLCVNNSLLIYHPIRSKRLLLDDIIDVLLCECDMWGLDHFVQYLVVQ